MPAVVGDRSVAHRADQVQLGTPGVGRQRPAVAEDDGLAAPPVLVVDTDAVLGDVRAPACEASRIVLGSSGPLPTGNA